MDKIKFAYLISWIAAQIRSGADMGERDIEHINILISNGVQAQPTVDCSNLDCLLACMGTEGKKIEAIRHYRVLTNMGLKEAKDAVERYWVQRPTQ